MSQTNVQFSVACHIMAALAMNEGGPLRSAILAGRVNADPTFVRRAVSKLAKAGLVITTRGKGGACVMARPASEITLLDVYRASEAPAAVAIHDYAVDQGCRVSRNIKQCMASVLIEAQRDFEQRLARQTVADVVGAIRQGA